jgi:thymidylate synthase (FAD)
MNVKLIAITAYVAGEGGTEELIEHAGRICTRSESRGDAGAFVRRRIEQGHGSLLEHASASFEISGISRACSHQLVRHRIASYSMESQRYVSWKEIAEECSDRFEDTLCSVDEVAETMRQWFVQPPSIADNTWVNVIQDSCTAYLCALLQGVKPEDARFLLPIATTTRLLMTANFRELLHVFRLRISPAAQWEIREVCKEMLRLIRLHAPAVFGDLLPLLEVGDA